jgi:hypothetical protein
MSVWLWNPRDRRLEELIGEDGSWSLLAADSWFAEDGWVWAFDRHRSRFGHADAQIGVCELVTHDFWAAVVEKIPVTGVWFHRMDVLEVPSGAGTGIPPAAGT